jgi:hypothetical protein
LSSQSSFLSTHAHETNENERTKRDANRNLTVYHSYCRVRRVESFPERNIATVFHVDEGSPSDVRDENWHQKAEQEPKEYARYQTGTAQHPG